MFGFLGGFFFGFGDEFGDGFELFGFNVGIFEGVGGLVADSGEAEGAKAEELLGEAVLVEADILDAGEIDKIDGTGEGGSHDHLDDVFISDKEAVATVNYEGDEAGKKHNCYEGAEDNIHEIGAHLVEGGLADEGDEPGE